MGQCDYDHEDPDVRRLPLYDSEGKRGSAAVFVCDFHWTVEMDNPNPPGRRPNWREWENLDRQEG